MQTGKEPLTLPFSVLHARQLYSCENQLRRTYLTEKFYHTINQSNEIEETMKNMGSSAEQLETYVKK
jgi:hypothetical protein